MFVWTFIFSKIWDSDTHWEFK